MLTLSQLIKSGGVFAYPTESVWGLGCDPFNETAVTQILNLKKRPIEKGVILLAGDTNQTLPFLSHLPPAVTNLIIRSWETTSDATSLTEPQAITYLIPLVYENKHMQQSVPAWITGEHNSLALRITSHPLVKKLCQDLGHPLVSTSCNPANDQPATTLAQAQAYFGNNIAYFAEETLGFTLPSKIINAITLEQLR